MGRAVQHAHGWALPHEWLLFQGFASRAADADLSSPCASTVVVRLLSITAAATSGSKKRQRPNLHVKLASRCMRPRQWEEETSLPQKLAKTNSSDNKSPPARATCPDGAVCSSLCWPRWPTDQSDEAMWEGEVDGGRVMCGRISHRWRRSWGVAPRSPGRLHHLPRDLLQQQPLCGDHLICKHTVHLQGVLQ
ncbi:uncharacterized protein LOC120665461 isoform X5 [Panicum virgatum]|uniref:Uncharacterized protein n=2 Tax=Panicum virgatum TaxID=38727 RepID=A0A8T0UAD5_PANVG|nr:uncharacterized protein LOC120665461 isoform X2 [Panicum virgatum]XP_039800965.1 uncharacterized protein LOC120665461 isoform X3 [Panicum virgatum]XP_039800966.1 uncharacterized protein LOC120665461 isoform X4 [Panicum virgatum]XP_039800967.1 uncharacterized protein LOC120665461 isoform X5 [Panicum virgatum]KAG2619257.1 hypothetical protein PVAP13_3NG140889 [Panicum virgatum]